VGLIAANFLREQRWPVVILLLWVAALCAASAFSELRRTPDDVFVLFQQVAVYILVFSLFFGTSAIRNELKTRRLLAVLSKGISRRQYVAGLLLGIVLAVLLYCVALGLAGTWVLPQVGVSAAGFWWLMAGLLAASLLTASLALFFSVFLHPLLATAATALIVGTPLLLANFWGKPWLALVPVFAIVSRFMDLSAPGVWGTGWLIAVALAETIAMWLACSWVFDRRDIAAAME
jgi:ABC-type transport system involved in multi-copper enzyme maturation permease subunit